MKSYLLVLPSIIFFVHIFINQPIFQHSAPPPPVNCDVLTEENADDCIRLNQIQVLGSHNSYHLEPSDTLVELLDNYEEGWADNISYSHRRLTEQLEELGIRQFELDIFADPEGGQYARPSGALLTNDESYIDHPDMLQPGFKVIHGLDVDYRTTCLTFISCLTEIRDWSLQNSSHLPIMILVELKGGTVPADRGPVTFTTPVEFDRDLISGIDAEIRTVFEADHIITPDDVRGNYPALEEAIQTDGWPTLSESRGRILFALDNTNVLRDYYLADSPGLEGRVMFTSSEPGEPTAAFIKMNDTMGAYDLIKERTKAGYLVRTRSDIPVQEAKTGDTTRRDAALTSGAQYVSTDYPEVSPFGSGYIVELPDAVSPGRCNPVSAPPSCQNQFITE